MTYFVVYYWGKEGQSTIFNFPRLPQKANIDVPAGPAIMLKRIDKKEPQNILNFCKQKPFLTSHNAVLWGDKQVSKFKTFQVLKLRNNKAASCQKKVGGKAFVANEAMNLKVSAIYLEKKNTQKRNICFENHASRKLFFSVSGKLK